MRNAVTLLFLFACLLLLFSTLNFFENLGHHFLIFDEFLIKASIRSLSQTFQLFFQGRFGEYHSFKSKKYALPKPEQQTVTSL